MGRRIGGQRGETDDEERKGKASIKTTAQTERERECGTAPLCSSN